MTVSKKVESINKKEYVVAILGGLSYNSFWQMDFTNESTLKFINKLFKWLAISL